MELKIIIQGELPDMNSYIKALSNNRFTGGKIKQVATDKVAWETKKFATRKLLPPYHFIFNWYCKNKKKDKDNISSMGIKVIFDGLQKSKVIPQDTWNVIQSFENHFFIDAKNPRIEVFIQSLTIKNNEKHNI